MKSIQRAGVGRKELGLSEISLEGWEDSKCRVILILIARLNSHQATMTRRDM